VNLKQISDSIKYRTIALRAVLDDLELLWKELEEVAEKWNVMLKEGCYEKDKP
jgi:hypothetical protein